MSYFNNSNSASSTESSQAPVIRVPAEKQVAYDALMSVLTNEAISNADAAWLGLLNNVPNPFSNSQQLLELQASRIQAYLGIGASVFPKFDGKGIIFVDDAPEMEVVQAFMNSGIPCYGAEWNEDEKLLVGCEWKAYYTQIVFSPEGKAQVSTELWVVPPYSEELHGKPEEFNHVGPQYMGGNPSNYPLAIYQVKHLVEILDGLSAEEIASFVAGVSGMVLSEPGVVTLKPAFGNTLAWAECKFDFINKMISTSREFPQRLESFITDIGAISVYVSMALQAIEIAGLDGETSQRRIDAMLAARTQVFEEEDLYGAEMFADEQLRTIREHSVALLAIKEGNEFPFYELMDNNSPEGVGQCINWLLSEGRQFFPDKNGAKRVVVDQGVTALMLGMVGDTGVFVTDVQKPKKTLNRNWQAVAIRAMEGLPGTPGYKPYQSSALRVMNRNFKGQDGEGCFTCGVTGDPTIMLLHNGRLLNAGSGVGFTRRQFSYIVPKKLRGTVSSIHIPAGKTLADVELDLTKKLMALFDGRVIKSTDPGKTKTLLEYNGIPVIKYSATNTDILMDAKYGSWSIKHLSSSNSLSVEINVPFIASDYEVKARGAGIKAVLQKASSTYVIHNDDWSINTQWEGSLNMECQKGQLARLHLYCESLRDLHGNNSYLEFGAFEGNHKPTAVLHYPVGGDDYLVQDLDNIEAPFYQWQRDNFKTYFITDVVNLGYARTTILGQANMLHRRHEGLAVIQEALQTEEWNDVIMVDSKGKPTDNIEEALVEDDWGYGIRLCEKVEGLIGTYPVMVECATRRESSAGKQAGTLEQMALTWAGNPKVGQTLVDQADVNLEAVAGMVAMATNDPDLLLDEEDIASWM